MKNDEEELQNEIDLLSKSYKSNNTSTTKSISIISPTSSNNIFTSSISNANTLCSTVDMEDFITQNVVREQKIIKCILVGDKQIGKTSFKAMIMGENSSENSMDNINSSYKTTISLDISKRLFVIKKTNVKLELWDTNLTILNSMMVQSK